MGLDRISRRGALITLISVAVLTFAGLTALAGGREDPVDPQPTAVTVAQPVFTETQPDPQTVAIDRPAEPPTQTAVGPPTEAESQQDAMDAQGERGGSSTATAAGSGEPLAKQVGRMIMTGYTGSYPSQTVLGRVRRGEVGAIILMGENVGPRTNAAIGALQAAAEQAGRRLLIATDQEGGTVQRFPGAPTSSAAGMTSAQTARQQGKAAGQTLSAAGVNVDLAPVADVGHPGGFLGSRAFSSSPTQVAKRACAFVQGLKSAGVQATLKHFPGLGYATRNTDVSAATIDQGATALNRDLVPYRRCRPGLVMMSNAAYSAYDPGVPAVFSKQIVDGILRGQLGYTGVVISDSLTATSVTSPTTAVRAAQAGVDMLLYIPEQISSLAYRKVLAAARAGRLPRSQVRAAAARIEALTR
ncbi:MAG: glycoside hydrolase family 3 N-terminal domain-containing protein [Solirubrobacteraceae bacterium]